MRLGSVLLIALEAVKLNRFALEEVLAYPCGETGTLVYAFRPRRVGNAPSAGWFAVVLHAVGAPDKAALREAFAAMGRSIDEASHQEMRSLVCTQCHAEYYFKTAE